VRPNLVVFFAPLLNDYLRFDTPEELLDIIEQKGNEIQEALAILRG
jgi:hypothetical protein